MLRVRDGAHPPGPLKGRASECVICVSASDRFMPKSGASIAFSCEFLDVCFRSRYAHAVADHFWADAAHRQAPYSQQLTTLCREVVRINARIDERDALDQKILKSIEDLVTGLEKVEGWITKRIEARVLSSQVEMAGKVAEAFGELKGS